MLLAKLHQQGLTAAKLGCGAGHCGACAVWVDGRVELSCGLPHDLDQALPKSLVTLENLPQAEPEIFKALERNFNNLQAAQCGYCISGILMRAAKLLKESKSKASPLSSAEIKTALDAHLCRCGAHQRIVTAVLQAAQEIA